MRKRLLKKGWDEEDINHAHRILSKAQVKKSPSVKHLEAGMFWVMLMLGILGSSILALACMPILLATNYLQGAFISMLFGFLLGSLMLYISKRMHWLGEHHHAGITLGVAVSGVVSFAIVAMKANELNILQGSLTVHLPLLLGFTYFLGFIAPYSFFTLINHLKRINNE